MDGIERHVISTDLDLPNPRRGKVRDTYDLGPRGGDPSVLGDSGPSMLIVATDRISAFDVVLPTPVPGKGRLLTGLAEFWLRLIQDRGLSDTHLISTDAGLIPGSAFRGTTTTREDLIGRVTIGRKCRVIPIEFVVRGYLEGSGWREYEVSGSVCGVSLPAGLERCGALPGPIFTPATKAEDGEHDENITFDRACAIAGAGLMETLRDRAIAIYRAAHDHALERGIILADTKFEFGFPVVPGDKDEGGADEGGADEGGAILIDEALTPDSSRFWPADGHTPGRAQASFDKQFVREYLETLVESGAWDKTGPGPELPDDIVEGTMARYREAVERLTN